MSLQKLDQPGGAPGEKSYLSPLKRGAEQQNAKLFDDESIIRQTLSTNTEKGFEMIYKRYYNQLCSHCIRYVYSSDAAKDITNEVFLALWRNELYLTIKTSFRAYLYTAVRNRSIDYLKGEFGLKKSKELNEGNIENQVDVNDPQSILLFNELMNKIAASINNFSPQCQRVFVLSRIEGRKNREIAEELDINIKTVEAHMMKALASLRKVLADYF